MSELVAITDLRVRPPFSTLFTVPADTRGQIAADMRVRGYDEGEPIAAWDDGEGFVVIDGHTRLEAARSIGLAEIFIQPHAFDSQLAALEYALHRQRDRRNWTEMEKLNAIWVVDEERRKPHGGDRGNQYTGGKIRDQILPHPRSSDETAAIVGVGRWTVSNARAIQNDPIAIEQVKGGVSITAAAHGARVRQETARRVKRDPIPMKQVWDEPWFQAMDHGGMCRSFVHGAALKVRERIEAASAQGLDIPALMREHRRVSTDW